MDAVTSSVPRTYDVFLNFRGLDTRTGFTDFLYYGLVAAGFSVFRDDRELEIGKKIGRGIFQAIKSSRIAIPIISEQYAQSHWCLDELIEIMDRHKKDAILVFPIFYKVDIMHVLLHGGKFKDHLRNHKSNYLSSVPDWEKALTSVAGIKGWISQTIANGNEAELVKMVVARVSSELTMSWIERLPVLGSVYGRFREKKRRESEWQVFLNFHGPDTGCGFAAFLCISLVAAGIRVFTIDDPSLIGKDVNHETENAIDCCRISIPIFSQDYASSRWRLKELVQMVECMRAKGQAILPIFYKVKASDVRHVSCRYKDHMSQHKEDLGASPSGVDTYNRWNEALQEAGSLKGWKSHKTANGHEGELVKIVVEKVRNVLRNPRTHDPASPSTNYCLNPGMSMPMNYEPDPSHVLSFEEIEVDDRVPYVERPIKIEDRREQRLRNKVISLVKVVWQHHDTEGATWESEKAMKNQYPYLFEEISNANFKDEMS